MFTGELTHNGQSVITMDTVRPEDALIMIVDNIERWDEMKGLKSRKGWDLGQRGRFSLVLVVLNDNKKAIYF